MWPEMDDCMTPVTQRAVKPFVDTHPHADLNSVIDNKIIETKLQDNCIPDIYVMMLFFCPFLNFSYLSTKTTLWQAGF